MPTGNALGMPTERIEASDYTKQILGISLLQTLLSQKWGKAEKHIEGTKKVSTGTVKIIKYLIKHLGLGGIIAINKKVDFLAGSLLVQSQQFQKKTESL